MKQYFHKVKFRLFNKVESSLLLSFCALENSEVVHYADRAKSAVLETRISWRQEALAKKKDETVERKGPETAPWPVSITRLLWLRQW